MGNPSIKIRIAGVVAAFAGASLLAVHLEWPPSTAADVNAELGRALAKETIQAIQPGGQVLAICRDTQEFPQPAMTQALRSFTKYLKTSGVEIRSIQSIAVDPLRPDEVPAGDFCEWIRKSKKSDVIVSFLGSPNLTEDQRLQLQHFRLVVVVP